MTVTDQDRMVCGVHLSEDERSVIILDQTQLPNRQVWLTLNTSEELCDAIRRLSVRGAPAIGICAGYGIYVLAQQIRKDDTAEFRALLEKQAEELVSTRPTAVNLSWAAKRMLNVINSNIDLPVSQIRTLLREECIRIHDEDIATPGRWPRPGTERRWARSFLERNRESTSEYFRMKRGRCCRAHA